jgi:hypothetical protein
VIQTRYSQAAAKGEPPLLAGSRRSGDEIHPWLPNGDLRPKSVIRMKNFECPFSRTYRTNWKESKDRSY